MVFTHEELVNYFPSHTPGRHNKNDHPSRLEISFLLDISASLSVLNYPTYPTIVKLH